MYLTDTRPYTHIRVYGSLCIYIHIFTYSYVFFLTTSTSQDLEILFSKEDSERHFESQLVKAMVPVSQIKQ
jgi:hypothetical protein